MWPQVYLRRLANNIFSNNILNIAITVQLLKDFVISASEETSLVLWVLFELQVQKSHRMFPKGQESRTRLGGDGRRLEEETGGD